MLDLLIQGGTVVADGVQIPAAIGIAGESIAGIWSPEAAPEAAEVVDATGNIVMPGAIDAHFHTKTGATYFASRVDDMESATRSAATGGVTTVIVFVWGEPGQPIDDYLGGFQDVAGALAVCDYAAHCGLRPDFELIKQVPAAFAMGVSSFKMHLDYRKMGQGRMSDDDHRLAAMQLIGRLGGLAMFHCENGHAIDFLEDEQIAYGRTDARAFVASRPSITEGEAVSRSIALSQIAECPVYVVHLSTALGLEAIASAQARGIPVATETCPQYLSLTHAAMDQFGVRAKVGPPLRTEADIEALWSGLHSGSIETIASDHSAQDPLAKELHKDDFFKAPFGTPVIDVMLSVAFTRGVLARRISLSTFVRAFTEAPARRFGLYPRKGTLQPGADADILVWDPDAEWTVRADQLPNPAGYSIFEGMRLRGRARRSWLRGRPLLTESGISARPGSGRWLFRSTLGADS
jgi:dihydropyrimidinase